MKAGGRRITMQIALLTVKITANSPTFLHFRWLAGNA
jgi:hypothetical protein